MDRLPGTAHKLAACWISPACGAFRTPVLLEAVSALAQRPHSAMVLSPQPRTSPAVATNNLNNYIFLMTAKHQAISRTEQTTKDTVSLEILKDVKQRVREISFQSLWPEFDQLISLFKLAPQFFTIG
jgi:hypothetical protein